MLVDNASPEPQETYLQRIEALGVDVLRSPENLGYARGMNACYERARRAPHEVVAVLNPDLHFLPGTVTQLLDYVLDHPECGVVDPATSIDALGVFNLPRNLLPTPLEHVRVTLGDSRSKRMTSWAALLRQAARGCRCTGGRSWLGLWRGLSGGDPRSWKRKEAGGGEFCCPSRRSPGPAPSGPAGEGAVERGLPGELEFGG